TCPEFTNGERFQFKYTVRPHYQALHRFIKDVAAFGPQDDLLGSAGEIPEQFKELLDDKATLGAGRVKSPLDDYREFYEFDIEILRADPLTGQSKVVGKLGNRLGSGSGGEHRAPLYVIAGAALASAYRLDRGHRDGLRLILLDEAFNKMDHTNIMATMRYLQDLGLQIFLASPGENLGVLNAFLHRYYDILRELGNVERVIVECHPAFLGERARRFRDALDGRTLEVAIGLETIQPGVLERLNKGMTLDSFVQSAEFLDHEGMSLRVFLMLRPPFTTEEEGIEWACRSIDFAVESGATACTVIPTRGGNGAMEALGDAFSPPDIRSLEQVIDYGVGRGRMRVFADLWDVERMFVCACGPARAERLARMNLEQRVSPEVTCRACRPAQGTNREG
ncbi:MAG TPA: SbcC/MukB-like Walker B domain-containing protein, partial [Blastocatellia bacterium]|nr:SbcC/MukB-like Walker B domain-containing protein [Blastocatellia bacterium]